jgi:hypothetical protein
VPSGSSTCLLAAMFLLSDPTNHLHLAEPWTHKIHM